MKHLFHLKMSYKETAREPNSHILLETFSANAESYIPSHEGWLLQRL